MAGGGLAAGLAAGRRGRPIPASLPPGGMVGQVVVMVSQSLQVGLPVPA